MAKVYFGQEHQKQVLYFVYQMFISYLLVCFQRAIIIAGIFQKKS